VTQLPGSVQGRGQTDGTTSFTAAFEAHYDDTVGLAYLLCGNRQRAEDATAEAFAKMLRRWSRVDNPGAYVRRAVVNEINSRFRRLRLERQQDQRRHGDDRGQRAHDDEIADREAVLEALGALPRRQRTAVVLRYYEQMTEAEAADVMDCAVGTVKSNTARGLDRLRVLLEGGTNHG
jgi:RNA polymerase sigma-70 factor (sigma-E family)